MIKVKDLNKKYGRKTALKDISFELGDGICGILGTNGAGKTTLIRCLAGMTGYSGSIDIGKSDDIGYLPQQTAVFPNLSVYDNLYFYAELKNISKTLRKNAIDEAIKLVNLDDNAKTKGRELSGGMKRRVAIAEALLGHPSVLLLDEPTVGLDPEERLRFKRTIRAIRKDTIILMSTHIVEDIEAVADKIIIIDEGEIKALGSADDIRAIAGGKVFEIPQNEVSDTDYVVREEDRDNEIVSRVITTNPGGFAIPVEPTVEDGYLCSIKRV